MKAKRTITLHGSLLMVIGCFMITWQASAQIHGSRTGTGYDGYVINNDNSNHWSVLRLQTFTDKAWNILNQNGLAWRYSTSSNHGDLGSVRMKLTTDGNLGIGTTTPRGALDVDGSGDIYLVDNPNNNGSQSIYVPGHMYIAPYNGGDIAYVQARRQNNSGSTSMRLRTYNSGQVTEAVHIDSEGNVGIGTVNPDSGLHLHQTTNDISGGVKIVNSANGRQLNLFVDGSNDSRIESGSTGFGELILNSGGGNVGIGTTSPAANLHVDGTSQFDETAYFSSYVGIGVSSPVSTLHLQQVGDNFNGGIKIENSGQTHQLNLFIDGSQRSRLDAASDGSDQLILNLGGGNVGIGTATPDANLAVNGDIHAHEVRVDMIGWPDYVFENDYKLRSLEAVEKYIKKNKHLPGIPSEAEVIENGANLGEMNAKLLQKIEELTLYLIEQNKQLGKQNQEIEALKARIVKSEKQ